LFTLIASPRKFNTQVYTKRDGSTEITTIATREEAIKFAHAIRRPDLIETIRFVDSFPQLTLL